jgi:hypothetical protein
VSSDEFAAGLCNTRQEADDVAEAIRDLLDRSTGEYAPETGPSGPKHAHLTAGLPVGGGHLGNCGSVRRTNRDLSVSMNESRPLWTVFSRVGPFF